MTMTGPSTALLLLSALVLGSSASSLFFRSEIQKGLEEGLTVTNTADLQSKRKDSKAYFFVADGKKKPYSFIDEFGVLVGFDVDLVEKVCAIAGKRCYTTLAPFTDCIFTDRDIDYAGEGLSARHFDACPGYEITKDRENVFDFTLPYLVTSASFTVAPGNPTGFDPESDDYSKSKMLHLTGAPTNFECLTRLGKKFGPLMIGQNLPDAKAALLNGTADVLFSPRNVISGLEVLPYRTHCSEVGAGIMLRKGSNLMDWWDPAFKTFYMSGSFNALCKEAETKYGRAPKCIPQPDKASPELLALFNAVPRPPVTEHLYQFVVSGRVAPFSFLNKDGELVGFTRAMMERVCELAAKRCSLALAEVVECGYQIGERLFPGRGMTEGWFDGCTGYFDTPDRRNSFDFTHPYLASNSMFKVKPGNPSGFDPSSRDYSKFVIVQLYTAITNDHCLNRLDKKFGTLLKVETPEEAVELVLNGTADTWFTKYHEPGIPLETLSKQFHCGNVGTSIMVKKGSEIPDWWNPAFDKFYRTGEFNRFCRSMEMLYDAKFPCLPPPESIETDDL